MPRISFLKLFLAMGCAWVMPVSGQDADPVSVLSPAPLAGLERLGQRVVAVPGIVICGAPGYGAQATDAGGVLVFRLDRGLNRWIADAWFTVPGAQAGDGFGAAVAASGTTLSVGSSGDSRVAIFDLDEPAATPAVLVGGPDFGRSLAIDGDTLVVGEPQRAGQIGRGRARVFLRTGPSSWTPTQTLAVDSLALNAGFGTSLAIRGDQLLVGAPSAMGTGAAYLYRRSGAGSAWTLAETIRPGGLLPGDQFGAAVAIGDRELVVGAPASDVAAGNGGAAFIVPVAVGTGALDPAEPVFAPNAASNALFGSAVAARGDLVAIGAPLGDGFAGDAWVFRRQTDESFVPAVRLAANADEPFAGFATSLTISDEFIVAGAPQLDASPFQPDAGVVAVYDAMGALGLRGDCDANGTDDLVDLFVARTATDCNGNGRIDACEIADNPALDSDGDGVLDGCVIDCAADLNLDGLLTPADFNAWLVSYNQGCP